MLETVTKPRNERIKENRKKLFMKKFTAGIGAALLTFALVAVVYLDEGTANARGFFDKYIVQKGDTLYNLSKRFDSSVDEIKTANQLKSDTILIGQKLTIPNPSPTSIHAVQKGETLYSIAKIYHLDLDQLKDYNHLKNNHIYVGQSLSIPSEQTTNYIATKAHEADMGISEYYTVVVGDTLWGISKRFAVPFLTLKTENKLTDNEVYLGQKLLIPGEKHFAKADVVGAADNHTVEFLVEGYPVPLKVGIGQSSFFQSKEGEELFISYKNEALISFFK